MSNVEEIHFGPDLQGTIASKRAESLDWTHVLGELIDNAFDAGATRVEIALNGRELTVEDNGDGCDDLEKMLTMGLHSNKKSTRLGRYGVGLKDSAWWVGGPTLIETRCQGSLRRIRLDWDRMTAWSAPKPLVESTDKRGTRIRFESMNRTSFPYGQRLEDMLSELAFIYSPALLQQRQIEVRRGRSKPQLLQRYELPELTDVIDTDISVDGKTAHVHVGIVPEGKDNPRPGIIYTHAFRVIMHCALGCGSMSSKRIAGWVSLDKKWTLARNKDSVANNKEELGDAVFAAIRPILEKASKQAMVLKSAQLASELTAMFRGMVGGGDANAKAKRDPKNNETGAIQPTGTGRKHRKARRTQPGESITVARAGEFSIDFRHIQSGAIGEVDLDGRRVWLADNHPTIVKAKSDDNKLALVVAAALMFVARDADSPRPLLPLFRDGANAKRFELAAGMLLADFGEDSKRSALQVAA